MKRPATEEELASILDSAKQKLRDVPSRLDAFAYSRLLADTMKEIAASLELKMPGTESEWSGMRTTHVLDMGGRSSPGLHDGAEPMALLVEDGGSCLGAQVIDCCASGKVRAVFALPGALHAEMLADLLDGVPVFAIGARSEAVSILRELVRAPTLAVQTALNNDQVTLRFLEGRAT